ncbi:hypothetical protein KBX03_07575 [Micromonospora sp. C72]|uniref:hypothetical protein n=1 Tax=Micromonospora sp. C72 TaxID=2824880 RepID=UPI001B365952|nr:hypothetical protein [Micromonospora sp. C72]MBQ1042363.1 hypothetical protein [Micromonospora sp. C72]
MAVAITATQQDVWPPRVLISVTGLTVTGTADSVDVYRETGGERTPVRAGSTSAVTDTAFLVIDAELPFGVPVTYVAVVDGNTEYSTGPTTYVLDNGKVAITDAINGSAAEVVILAWPDKTRTRQATVFRVGGRNAVVSGDLGMFEGDIELYVETTSGLENLIATLENATEGVVQIRQSGEKAYDGVDCYVAVLGVTERRWSQDGSDPRRRVVLNVAEVEGWAPALEARGTTLQDIANAYDGLTLQDIANDYPTLLDLAQADLS